MRELATMPSESANFWTTVDRDGCRPTMAERYARRNSGIALNPLPTTGSAAKVQPVGDESRVNRAEVGMKLEVAVVEIIETRVAADQSGLWRPVPR